MTEEFCSTLSFPAPRSSKAEGVLNTCRKFVWRQERGGGEEEEEEEVGRDKKKKLKVSRAGHSLGQYSNLQRTRYEIQALTIQLMHAFVRRVKINSRTQ
jgi:hypothetical protein